MRIYEVSYIQDGTVLGYLFHADNILHAIEQFEDAEPNLKADDIVSVYDEGPSPFN